MKLKPVLDQRLIWPGRNSSNKSVSASYSNVLILLCIYLPSSCFHGLPWSFGQHKLLCRRSLWISLRQTSAVLETQYVLNVCIGVPVRKQSNIPVLCSNQYHYKVSAHLVVVLRASSMRFCIIHWPWCYLIALHTYSCTCKSTVAHSQKFFFFVFRWKWIFATSKNISSKIYSS